MAQPPTIPLPIRTKPSPSSPSSNEGPPWSADTRLTELKLDSWAVNSRSMTAAQLYLLSSPVPANPQHVRFTLVSHDDGACWDMRLRGKYKAAPTWFEASIFRPAGTSKGEVSELPTAAGEKAFERPGDCAETVGKEGWEIVEANAEGRRCWYLQANKVGVKTWQKHEVVWGLEMEDDGYEVRGAGTGAEFVKTLREGDRIGVWARAVGTGSTNYVREAHIDFADPSTSLTPAGTGTADNEEQPMAENSASLIEILQRPKETAEIDTDIQMQIAMDKFFEGGSVQEMKNYYAKVNGIDPARAKITLKPVHRPLSELVSDRSNLSLVGPLSRPLFGPGTDEGDARSQPGDGASGDETVSEGGEARPELYISGYIFDVVEDPDAPSISNVTEEEENTQEGSDKESSTSQRDEWGERFPEPFCYDKLCPEKKQIRLLGAGPVDESGSFHEIELRSYSLDEAPSFYALSYVWNNPTRDFPIACNGQQLKVTESLFLAIRRSFDWKSGILIWADGICINQDDPEERASQVLLMGEIYSRASQVLAHMSSMSNYSLDDKRLSESCWAATALMKILCRIWFFEPEFTIKSDGDWAALKLPSLSKEDGQVHNWSALALFWSDRWFTRAWILQEAVLGKEVVVFFGEAVCQLSAVLDFWTVAQRHHLPPQLRYGRLADMFATFLNSGQVAAIKYRREMHQNSIQSDLTDDTDSDSSLLALLAIARLNEASDPRDKVYSLLSLAKDSVARSITPRYTEDYSAADLFIEVAEKYIKSGAVVDLLQHAGTDQQMPGLPSWVPDWTYHSRSTLKSELYRCAGRSKPQAKLSSKDKKLTLRGVVVDTIKYAGLPYLYYATKASGIKFIQTTEMQAVAESVGSALPEMDDEEAMHTVYSFSKLMADGMSSEKIYPEGTQAALGRTLTADCTWSKERSWADGDFLERFQAYAELHEMVENPPPDTDPEDPNLDIVFKGWKGWFRKMDEEEEARLKMKAWPWEVAVQAAMKGRRICFTKAGYMCAASNDTDKKDLLVIFEGFPTPLVLRPVGQQEYQYLGNCYVHGLMDGELVCSTEQLELGSSQCGVDDQGTGYAIRTCAGEYGEFQDFTLV